MKSGLKKIFQAVMLILFILGLGVSAAAEHKSRPPQTGKPITIPAK